MESYKTSVLYNKKMNLIIFTDGGSLHNPGKAASSFLIYNGKKLLDRGAKHIGIASNNVAEYTALILALEKVKDIQKKESIKTITCYADSNLMVQQLRGVYKIKHPEMKKLNVRIKLLEMELGIVPSYHHIPREKNEEADFLVKEVLYS